MLAMLELFYSFLTRVGRLVFIFFGEVKPFLLTVGAFLLTVEAFFAYS